MDLGLEGHTAVVTGGSRGIGLAIVRGLAASGAQVITGSLHSSAELDELTETGQVRFTQVDLADPAGPGQLMALAGERIDILVNNVGAARTRTGGFLSITDDDWQATLNLDLMAAVRATRSALPAMLAAGKGSIVTICSVNARLPDPAVLDYSAAKAAIASFCKSLSKEVGGRGVRVNTVSPGPVATDLWLGAGEWPTPSAGRPARARRTCRPRRPATRRPIASPGPMKWLTWCSSWPASARGTSPEPISSSMAASSRPCSPAGTATRAPTRTGSSRSPTRCPPPRPARASTSSRSGRPVTARCCRASR